MTSTARPVRRETFSSVRERGKTRPIVVELATTYVKIRLKGTRRVVTVTYDQLWLAGNRNAAEAARRERAERQKERRRG